MTIFTIHVPRQPVEPDVLSHRLEIVAEAFSWGAFLLGPLWLLRNRLWLALVLWLAAVATIWLLAVARFPSTVLCAFLLLLEFLLGLEGNGLLASALRRRGLELADVVAASGADEALRSYFERAGRARPPASPATKPAPRSVVGDDEFVGLSPEGGG